MTADLENANLFAKEITDNLKSLVKYTQEYDLLETKDGNFSIEFKNPLNLYYLKNNLKRDLQRELLDKITNFLESQVTDCFRSAEYNVESWLDARIDQKQSKMGWTSLLDSSSYDIKKISFSI